MKKVKGRKPAKFDPVRAACVEVIGMVFDRGWRTDDAIHEVLNQDQFTELDRRFMMQLCHGVVKMKQRLDFTYSHFLEKPKTKIDRVTRNILRLGLYQLIFTDRIPHGAAVSESVNLARGMVHHSRGAFVNAILRNYLRTPEKVEFPPKEENPVGYLANYYSYPEWFVEYCLNEFGAERAEAFLARGNDAPTVTFRVNHLRYTDDQLAELLTTNKVEFEQGKYLASFFHIHKQGLPLERDLIDSGRAYIQDEAAGLSVRMLQPMRGDNILDLCSAPGGKATYAAILMHNNGRITAVDVSIERLEKVVENARRQGIQVIAPVVCDVLDFKGPKANKILIDVPCSGWGVVGKHSDLRWLKTREDSTKLAAIQKKLINHAADLLLPGGTLIYSTCTIMRDENDQVVEEFLLEHPDFWIDSGTKFFPKELVNDRGFVKTYPDLDHIDGAFCVRLKKKLGRGKKKS